MKSMRWVLFVFVALFLCGCAVTLPDFAKDNAAVNNPVRDTLFVNLRDYEDEWVSVRIKSNDTDYMGREQVTDGRAWFDIRRLATGYYTVWIEVADLRFPQHIWHERAY